MKLAFVSDVHADAAALRDALAWAERLGCERVVCLGDLVDDGPAPEATIRLLRDAQVATIRGNHDRWAAAQARDMAGRGLSLDELAFLDALPPSWSQTIHGVRVAAWHARADVLVVGHTHRAFARAVGARLVANPGCLLRDPVQPRPSHHVLDASGRWVVERPLLGTFGILTVTRATLHFEVRHATDGELVLARETARLV